MANFDYCNYTVSDTRGYYADKAPATAVDTTNVTKKEKLKMFINI